MWQSPITIPFSKPHKIRTTIPTSISFSFLNPPFSTRRRNGRHFRRHLLLHRNTPRRRAVKFRPSPSPILIRQKEKPGEEIAFVKADSRPTSMVPRSQGAGMARRKLGRRLRIRSVRIGETSRVSAIRFGLVGSESGEECGWRSNRDEI